MAYGTVNADVVGTSVANSNLGAGNASTFKNKVINGAMTISQYNGTTSVTPASGNVYLLDRWAVFSTTASKFTFQQNAGGVTPPAGFSNYLGITSTSAYTLVTDNFFLFQRIEANNLLGTNWGTANATPLTLSFWVYSSLTGTFAGGLQNGAQNRSFPFTYTVTNANTWQQITLAVPADTTGGPYTGTSSGFQINLGFGNNTATGTPTGAWQAGNSYTASSGVSVVSTNGATFYVTGVQLEVGSSATGFDYRSYGTELLLCQRYFSTTYTAGTALGSASSPNARTAYCLDNTSPTRSWFINCNFPVPMRILPTTTIYNFVTGATGSVYEYSSGVTRTVSSINNGGNNGDQGMFGYMLLATSESVYAPVQFHLGSSAEL
jgi:hypothetical protein